MRKRTGGEGGERKEYKYEEGRREEKVGGRREERGKMGRDRGKRKDRGSINIRSRNER